MEAFFQWYAGHTSLVSSTANVLMLLVWLFYAHLLFINFRIQSTPLIHIHETQGGMPDAACLIVNLGKEPIHILGVVAIVQTDQGCVEQRITKYDRQDTGGGSQGAGADTLKEGPLMSGDYLYLSAFQGLLKDVCEVLAPPPDAASGRAGYNPEAIARTVQNLEIRVIALHTHYRQPIGACRTFRVRAADSRLDFQPVMRQTRQWTSFWQRRRVIRWLSHQQQLEQRGGTRLVREEREDREAA